MLLTDEVRLTRDAMRYGFAVGKVRVLATRALDGAAVERLLDAPSFAEQKRLLSESPYGRFLENAQTAEDVERGLADALDSFYGFLSAAALPEAVTRFFLIRYDFANLKAAAKARLLGAPIQELLVGHGTVPLEEFSGELTALPEPLGSVAATLPLYRVDSDPDVAEVETMVVDTLVDQAMYSELLDAAHEARSAYLVELARLGIDVANARTLVRGRVGGLQPRSIAALLIDGGNVSAESLAPLTELAPGEIAAALAKLPALRGAACEDLERPETLDIALDAVNSAAWRRGRVGGQVGPEPVISYVLAREAEVIALRIMLLGRLAGIDNNKLRARVRAVS